MKEKKTTIMINGQTIDLLREMQEEYRAATGVKIVVNDLIRRVLSKAKLKDIL